MTLFISILIFIINLTLYKSQTLTKDLTENDWKTILKGEWMIKFYAKWCPACKAVGDYWQEFADEAYELGVNVSQVDVTNNPELSGRFFITSLPTFYHVKDGSFRKANYLYDKDKMISYIKLQSWKNTKPLSFWLSPNTFHMAIIGKLFKAAYHLQELHVYMIETYGLPTYASYGLFIVITIFLGLFLGLVIAYCSDYISNKKIGVNFSSTEVIKKES